MVLMQAIVQGELSGAAKLLEQSPELSRSSLAGGATRAAAKDYFCEEIAHYLYAGDTPLHAAAAGHRVEIARHLLKLRANVGARNRRGAQPLHYAADGGPGSRQWNAAAQAELIALLIEAGADPNAIDKSGVAPLHRAVRQRCARAVEALLRGGADVGMRNGSGSMPLHLAVQNTGRGGTGSEAAKSLQREIIAILLKAGAHPEEKDERGKTAVECATSEWVREFLRQVSGRS